MFPLAATTAYVNFRKLEGDHERLVKIGAVNANGKTLCESLLSESLYFTSTPKVILVASAKVWKVSFQRFGKC